MTVEEAARLIRVGRTKAYAMAQQWRATGGRSGLPVVDFGHVLRVPRRALEELVGTELGAGLSGGIAPEPSGADGAGAAAVTTPSQAPVEPAVTTDATATAKSSRPPRRQRHRNRGTDQLDLFNIEKRQS